MIAVLPAVLAVAAIVTAARAAWASPARPVDAGPRWRAPVPRAGGWAPAVVRRALDSSAVVPDAGFLWRSWLAAAVAAPLLAGLGAGPGAALLAALVVVAGPVLALSLTAGRAARRDEAATVLALQAVARALRSGASLRGAIAEAAGAIPGVIGADLAAVAAGVDGGEAIGASLDQWARSRPLPAVRLAAAALALGAEGGPRAQAIDGVAATVSGRLALDRELAALSTQARLSAVVIAVAPVGFGVVAAAADPRVGQFLLQTPTGLVCMAIGLALDAVGAVWMSAIARGAR